MYATSQRLRTPEARKGINSFLSAHPGQQWMGWPPWLPDQNPGNLIARHLEVQQTGGNFVLSFLDVMAPDDMALDAIWTAFTAFLPRLQAAPRLPQGALFGGVWFRFDLQPALHYRAFDEIRVLFGCTDRMLVERWGSARGA